MVRAAGLEPTTSSMSTKRSTGLRLRAQCFDFSKNTLLCNLLVVARFTIDEIGVLLFFGV